jgi:spore maturation protein CgeB
MAMYRDFEARLGEHKPDAVIVDNTMPYHPDYLRRIPVYKVLRTGDGPMAAYDRDFAYAHAYDHVLYHSPAYSRDMSMAEKLRYVGAKRMDFWPFAIFDAAFDPTQTEETILARKRDIDVIFIGFGYRGKLPAFARIKKAFGRRVVMHGFSWKYNAYFNVKYGWPGWVKGPLRPGRQYVELYQRAKIGFNVHNRGDYTVGSYRLFELPANGVMQISDGGEYLGDFFEVGTEIERYGSFDELIDKIEYYLAHDHERLRIARGGYRRAMRDHLIGKRLHEAANVIARAMK